MNDASGAPGETPEYLALPTHAGLCVGGHFISLATRGTLMDLLNSMDVEEAEGSKGHSETEAVAKSGARAHTGTGHEEAAAGPGISPISERALTGTGGDEDLTGDASAPRKRNRCGAAKKRFRRDRERALTGQPPGSSTAQETPKDGAPGLTGKKRREGPGETPPSVKKIVKKPRAHNIESFAVAADPLARAVVLEGYPEKGITPEQLTSFRGAVLAEMEGILEGPLPRFVGPATLRNGAIIVRGADAASIEWLMGRVAGLVPWEGANFRVVGLEELQKRHRAVVWVPGPPRPVATVLALLERQNPGIGAPNWRVFAEGVGASPEGRNYVFGILESSIRKLKGLDFKLCYGIEQITIRVAGSHGEGSGGGGTPTHRLARLMGWSGVEVTQINLHHSKGASAVLARRQSMVHTAISLIQEPWVTHGCVRGVAACGKLFRAPTEPRPRACIAIKGLGARLLPDFCSRDLVAVETTTATDNAGCSGRLVVSSAYFPHGEEVPPAELTELVNFCQREGLPLVVGCDANSHHTIWGSTDTNNRGEKLLDYLVTTDLEILNRGNVPTFCTVAREEVIDITLCSRKTVREVVEWRVSDEPSLSDHRWITFKLTDVKAEVIKARNPRKTNWASYREDLEQKINLFPRKYGTAEELELCVDHIQRALVDSYEKNCPMRTVTNSKGTPWWNPRLQQLRGKARQAWNRARNTGRPSDRALYREAQKEYRDAVVNAKKKSWQDFCESVEGIPATARLCRFLSRCPDTALEVIRTSDGKWVSGEHCLTHLLEDNFPGFQRGMESRGPGTASLRARASDWSMAAGIVKPDKVRWAIGSFKPFKSAGLDRIFPALLQEGLEQIVGPLTRVLRACLALGYTPYAWRLARVVFIPKAGKTSHTSTKDFRPISLTSFLFKTLEKLVDIYIRDEVLAQESLHCNQHAYRAGFSCETALHSAVSLIERQLQGGGFVVGTFLDVEGAFNNTPHRVVCEEAARRGVPEKLVEWIRGMLGRQVVTSLGEVSVEGWVGRGCPQGGVLSPLLWCLVADRLLRELNDRGFHTIGYADDLAILIRGPFLETLLELTQGALEVVENWCEETGLSVNPEKTSLVIFTRKYKMGSVTGPVLKGTRLTPVPSVKYLGVVLDRRLNWKAHLDLVCKKTCTYFWMCRRTFGQTWGLQPGRVFWLYSAVLRPRLLYAAVVWWPRMEKVEARKSLERIRALVLRGALGAMRTTPVAAMGLLLGIEPLHLSVVAAAAAAAYRLKCEHKWMTGALHTRLPKDILASAVFDMGQDRMPIKRDFDRHFGIYYPSREEWSRHEVPAIRNGDIWYTDGSRTEEGTGAGIYGCRKGTRTALPLGELYTVFQSEVAAIMSCAQSLIASRETGRRIRICSDSRAALGALGARVFKSRLVWECKGALDQLSEENNVALVWVPGHSGIKGNEIADQLAREGSASKLIGPEPALSVACSVGRAHIRSWLREHHTKFWREETRTKCRQARALLGDTPSEELAKSIRTLRRGEARLAVQIYTGHGFTNYHMHKLGLSETPRCRKCDDNEETTFHVIGSCPAYVGLRRRLLGSEFLEPDQVRRIQVGDLLRFWKGTGLT